MEASALQTHDRMSKMILDLWFVVTMAQGDLQGSNDEICELSGKIMELNNKILANFPECRSGTNK